MNIKFNVKLASRYNSPSQKIRVLTEDWVKTHIYCPNCGNKKLNEYSNNKPVADFFCSKCDEDYELKSKNNSIGKKLMDGAYNEKIRRLRGNHNPNLFVLNYDIINYEVISFFAIPKYYFIPGIIERRNPLSSTARRAGWIGSNILLSEIPQNGKIIFIKNRVANNKNSVLSYWQKTIFMKKEKRITSRGWIMDVMICIDKLNKKEFSLNDIYSSENVLARKHPNNRHIRDKIRQQLQYLRDREYLEFKGNGIYKLI